VSLLKSASTVSAADARLAHHGLLRDLLMASVFGASALTDAFNVAFRIPNLFRRVFGEGAFSQAFVPVLAARPRGSGRGGRPPPDRPRRDAADLDAGGRVRGRRAGAPLLVWAMASGLQQDPGLRRGRGDDALDVPVHRLHVAGGAGRRHPQHLARFAVPAASPVLLNALLILSILVGAPLVRRWGIEPIYAHAWASWRAACCSWRCRCRRCAGWACCRASA
jgi:putative peptidoglycan lipid II flippase